MGPLQGQEPRRNCPQQIRQRPRQTRRLALSLARRKSPKEKGDANAVVEMNDSLAVGVDRFVAAARSFVRWCESPHVDDDPDVFRRETLGLLAELYAAAQHLPEDVYGDGPDVPNEPAGRREELIANLAPLPFQLYWEALEPANLDKDGSIACADIFDDLVDIHSDLADGLWLHDQGYPDDAVWHWRLLYFHWGHHVIGAMHALHLYEQPEVAAE